MYRPELHEVRDPNMPGANDYMEAGIPKLDGGQDSDFGMIKWKRSYSPTTPTFQYTTISRFSCNFSPRMASYFFGHHVITWTPELYNLWFAPCRVQIKTRASRSLKENLNEDAWHRAVDDHSVPSHPRRVDLRIPTSGDAASPGLPALSCAAL